MTRAENLSDVMEEYPSQDPGATGTERFALIEESVFPMGGYCVTTHSTPEEAASYHDDQEYPEDWEVIRLVDLDTGEEHRARITFPTTGAIS